MRHGAPRSTPSMQRTSGGREGCPSCQPGVLRIPWRNTHGKQQCMLCVSHEATPTASNYACCVYACHPQVDGLLTHASLVSPLHQHTTCTPLPPCPHYQYRFAPFMLGHAAGVSVFMDGSVLVHHSGVDMGQGISTKVKQVAALELGRVLPPHTHVPLESITTSPCNTTTLANQSMAAGSTTSESACQVHANCT